MELAGTEIECPGCKGQTVLETAMGDDAGNKSPVEIASLLNAFRAPVKVPGTSFLYQLGLLFVTAAIVILPLLYLCLVFAAGYGVYWWARNCVFLLALGGYGFYILIAKLVVYVTPIITGGIVLLFMIKPLLARRPPGAQPLALNPQNEPLLFAFVGEICRTVGAPRPARIDVDCQLNAAAGFRRGFRSFFGNDLVLTIGMPLVAGTSITQFGGIIAHEFGHFTQSFAMRLTYIIRRVNHWFARVIYDRDEWDLWLEDWAAEAEDWRVAFVIAMARMGVWFSRTLLKGLMWTGMFISSFVSRQMEYDADAYEIGLVGSGTFEETTTRFATLGVALDSAYKQMRVTWNSTKSLPESVPHFLMAHDSRMGEGKRAAIANRVGLEEAQWYSTHPATGDRIRCARRAQKEGVFSFEHPSTLLFSNFEVLARQVSLLHYLEDLDLPRQLIQLRPVETFFHKEEPVESTNEPARLELEKMLGPAKLRLQSSPARK
jgi:hypothetical protein